MTQPRKPKPDESTIEKWVEEAKEIGASKARDAASWVTDGNDSEAMRREKLRRICEGDPAMDDILPRRPDLSGEWDGAETPYTLIETVTGQNAEDVNDEAREAICNAYEEGVSETFGPACEEELLKWGTKYGEA